MNIEIKIPKMHVSAVIAIFNKILLINKEPLINLKSIIFPVTNLNIEVPNKSNKGPVITTINKIDNPHLQKCKDA